MNKLLNSESCPACGHNNKIHYEICDFIFDAELASYKYCNCEQYLEVHRISNLVLGYDTFTNVDTIYADDEEG